MKKLIIALVLLAIVGLVAWKWLAGNDEIPHEKQKTVAIAENTGPFNQSYAALLTAYYAVKDALVASDSVKATAAANNLVIASDGLKMNEIQGDSTGMIKETAKSYTANISSTAKVLADSKTLDDKRKQFEMIADAIWSLTRTVKYSGQKVYWQYCPMAFNDKGAYWMSNDTLIMNPYFGDEMLHCGSVEDSLDYSKK
jgi:Cu(I)/Ag(I) efflux system membrane fusion protein